LPYSSGVGGLWFSTKGLTKGYVGSYINHGSFRAKIETSEEIRAITKKNGDQAAEAFGRDWITRSRCPG
jgi:hypothetical protein